MNKSASRYAPFLEAVDSSASKYANFDPNSDDIPPSLPQELLPENRIPAFNIESPSEIVAAQPEKQMTSQEKWSLMLIFSLYFIGALPVGFYSSSLPILLAEKGSDYSNLGLLSLCKLLVSFKPLMAPILDTKYSSWIGRRRTYILPTQYLMGVLLVVQSFYIQEQLKTKQVGIISVAAVVFTLLSCVHEIAAAGWTISLVRREFAGYASTMATMGSYLSSIITHYIFILVTSKKFTEQNFSSLSPQGPLVTADTFIFVFGILALAFTLIIHILKDEGSSDASAAMSIRSTSKVFFMIKGFYTNKNLRAICIFLFIWKVGFSPVESVWTFRMIQKGYPKETLTLLQVFVIPLKLIANCLTGLICKKNREMPMLFIGSFVHLIENVFMYFIVTTFYANTNMNSTTVLILVVQVLSTIQGSLISISLGSFFNRVADKGIGGTYISTLQAIFSFGRHLSDSSFLFLNNFMNFTIIAGFGWAYAIGLFGGFAKTLTRLGKLDPKEFQLTESFAQQEYGQQNINAGDKKSSNPVDIKSMSIQR